MTKSLYGLPIEELDTPEKRSLYLQDVATYLEEKLPEKDLDNLQWAKEFMERYERKILQKVNSGVS